MTVRIQSFPAEYWSVLLMLAVSGFQSSSVPTWNIRALIYSLNRQAAELNFSSKVPGFTCRVNMSSSEKTSAPQHKKEPVKVPRASDQDGPCLLPSGISGMPNWDETPEQTLNPLEVLYITPDLWMPQNPPGGTGGSSYMEDGVETTLVSLLQQQGQQSGNRRLDLLVKSNK